jgi:hypothetical protein
MNRTLRHLLLAAALLFAQQAAQLHAVSHFRTDIAGAGRDHKGAPLGHPAAQCLVFHAVDSALADAAAPPPIVQVVSLPSDRFVLPLPFQPRIQFDSRAPPVLS